MKNKLSILILVLSLSGAMLISSCRPENATQVLVERESRYDFAHTVETLKNAALEAGWTVPIVHDMQANMHRAGVAVLPATIVELCHSGFAGEILSSDVDRYNLAILPCRVAVFQKADGKTYVSWMDYSRFSTNEHGISLNVFRVVSSELEEIVGKVVRP